ncbi:MAG TPA: hypothetical protein VHW69_11995 [Rhizomicrobium sp.]|jgi:hypothetical protein|nr:hypothetical protein [Rhizomicrobium sp.]
MARASCLKRPWDAIVWWEIRRPAFNAAVFLAGVITVFLIELIGNHYVHPGEDVEEPMAILFGSIIYGIAANIVYTLGWISEILWLSGETSKTEFLRSRIYRTGLGFSVILTLLPAVLVPLTWMIFGFQHGPE